MNRTEWYVSTTVMTLLAVLIGAGFIWASLEQRANRAIVHFRYPVVTVDGVKCPDDIISYRQEMIIATAPAIIQRVESVWSVEDEQTVLFDDAPEWTSFSEPVTEHRLHNFLVPNLSRGIYELRVAVTGGHYRLTSVYRVRFSVPALSVCQQADRYEYDPYYEGAP